MLTSWTMRAQLGQFKSSSQVPRGKPGFYYSHYSHLLFCFLFFSIYLDMSGGQESERLGVPALGSCSTAPRYSTNFLLTALCLHFTAKLYLLPAHLVLNLTTKAPPAWPAHVQLISVCNPTQCCQIISSLVKSGQARMCF